MNRRVPHFRLFALLASAFVTSAAAQAPESAPENASAAGTAPAIPGGALGLLFGNPQAAGALTDQAPFLAAALSEFFTDSRDYSAQADLILPGRERGDAIPIGLAVSEGRMRWQVNFDRVRSAHFPPERIEMLRQMRLDSAVLWLKPGEDLTVGLPRFRSWASAPAPESSGIRDKAESKVGGLKKTLVGKEVVDGHPCVKYMLTIPEENLPGQVALVWEAADLENLPIKILVKKDGQVHGFQLRNVRPGKMDERLFQPPAEWTRKPSVTALLQEGILRGLSGSTATEGRPTPLEGLLSGR